MTARPPPNTLTGMLLGAIGVVSFALTLPLTRLAIGEIDAGTVAVWRGLIAAGAAVLVLAVFFRRWPGRHQVGPLLITGLGIVIGFPVLTTLAMQTVPAAHGAVVIALLPITTAAFGVVSSRERPSLAFWSVSLAGTAAIVVFIFRRSEGTLQIGHVYLVLAVILAAIGYGSGTKVARQIGASPAICWALVFTAPVLVIAAFFVPPLPMNAPAPAVFSLLYLALISQLAGFFAWFGGLARGGVARVSQIQQLQIFITMLASAYILGEALDAEIWAFAIFIIVCVAIIARLRIHEAPLRSPPA
jgi:drug/metabolite transporter (DMT)-like permease